MLDDDPFVFFWEDVTGLKLQNLPWFSRLQGAGDTFRDASAHLCVRCPEDFRANWYPKIFGKLVCDSVHPNWFVSDTAFQHFERQSNEENQTVWKQPYRSTEALQ